MAEVPIRIEVVATAQRVSWNTVIRRYQHGEFPKPDARLSAKETGWSLPTLHQHDPALADRVQRILTVLEVQA